MAVRRIIPDMAYGIGDDLIPLAPLPIIALRDPGIADQAQLGTTWVNKSTGAVWILARIVANASDWVTSPVIGGAGVFTSLQVTSGSLTVDAGAGGIDVGAGNFSVDNAGNTVTNDITVNGTATLNGDFDLTSAALIDLTSTLNAAPSVLLAANGGANEQILLHSVQGTSASSIDLLSGLGGIVVSAGSNSSSAVHLIASNAAGGITASAGTGGITLAAANGAIALTSGTGAINIGADAAAHTITLGNSTGATSLVLNAGTGAINIGTNAIAHAITIGNLTGATAVDLNAGSGGIGLAALNGAVQITSGTGQMDISSDTAATTVNFASGAAVKTLVIGSTTGASVTSMRSGTGGLSLLSTNSTLAISSGTGVMNISADAAATTVNIATAAAVKTVTVGSTNTTSATTIRAGTAGITLTAPFVALPGPVYMYTGAGAPGNPLALHVGDIYINTTAASAVTRMYIATGVGAWTNVTCAA